MVAKNLLCSLFFIVFTLFSSCNKVIEIAEPRNQLTVDKIFENDQAATAIVSNIYAQFNNGLSINGNLTPFIGLLVDELEGTSLVGSNLEFYNASLSTDNSTVLNIWRGLYSVIYQSNALLEGLEKSNSLSKKIQIHLKGEALFLRSLSYFYLINLFGDVPLLTTTNVNINSSKPRTSSAEIYNQIIIDLKTAKELLTDKYITNERVRINNMAATALLARIYLFRLNWKEAEEEANVVINSNIYKIVDNVADIFKKGNTETILEFWTPNGFTTQGALLFPSTGTPPYYISKNLSYSFDSIDKRRTTWMMNKTVANTNYLLSQKYKRNSTTSGIDAEYLIFLRLSEQILIRAEAKAEQNKLLDAIDDINILRTRSGLPAIVEPISKDSCISLVQIERKRELFNEWGHRFFDLKRWNILEKVISPLKPIWDSKSSQLPIPQNEINKNPFLVQNVGY